MKKIVSLLLIMVLFLSGCSAKDNKTLENYNLEISRIVESETKKVLFSSEKENSKYDNAEIISLSCTANKNEITIKDNSTNKEWVLDYSINKTAETNNTEGAVFDISYTAEEKTLTGYATTGTANISENEGNDYLIITLGGYELHFIEMQELQIA